MDCRRCFADATTGGFLRVRVGLLSAARRRVVCRVATDCKVDLTCTTAVSFLRNLAVTLFAARRRVLGSRLRVIVVTVGGAADLGRIAVRRVPMDGRNCSASARLVAVMLTVAESRLASLRGAARAVVRGTLIVTGFDLRRLRVSLLCSTRCAGTRIALANAPKFALVGVALNIVTAPAVARSRESTDLVSGSPRFD